MVEKGIVESLNGEWVTIQCTENPYCASCKACEAGKGSVKILKVKKPGDLKIKPGSIVEIYISPFTSIKVSFMVFIMPILLFLLFYFLSGEIFTNPGEKIQILSGFVGIVLAFLLNYIYGKIFKNADMPVISKVLSQNVEETFYPDT